MDKIREKIESALVKVRPYIQMHGGEVELAEIKGRVIVLRIKGACANCPLAKLTYNKEIGELIKEKVPEVEKIVFIKVKNTQKFYMANQKEYSRAKDSSNIGKIVVDRDLCIGAASCVAVSPATFELDGENKAVVIDANAVDDEILKMAAQSCPTKAILLFDKEGEQIYP